MNPVRWSLRHPEVTLAVTAMVFLTGVHALLTMPRREDPKITIRSALVAAGYPGASPRQVEDQVTTKIEELLFQSPEVKRAKTYSTSKANSVTIIVELEDWVLETDTFWSKLRHELNYLKAEKLPKEVIGPVVDTSFGDTIAMLLAVHGEKYSYLDLKTYTKRIEDRLRTLRPLSKTKRIGEQQEQILITSSLERLSQYSLDPLQIIRALEGRNLVLYGGAVDAGASKALLKPTGLFKSEEQIRKLMVDVSRKTGAPVYLGDLADVTRRYQDPDQLVRYNGQKAVLLSIEMQEGFNIVDFGNEIRATLAQMRTELPPDLKIDLIADQPRVVDERVTRFIEEFGIAILSVILVTAILLPFRVASIAALAIPVTVAVTFGVMNALGIELHQVSIAALIVVLGMVVDDAVVIADNYVELLDRGVVRADAAWRCASEMAVPVLTATLTIIASFLPLLMLSGSVGEFIAALPIAVAVALTSSFVVAMLLTPLLCRFFIRKGLRSADEGTGKKKFNLLDTMQLGYNRTINWAMGHKSITVLIGVAACAGGFLVLQLVPEQFFPSAERNQFVIDVWMPEGTRVEATGAVMERLEGELSGTPLVASYATFLGASAPRFYYNVNPVPPAENYGQFVVNTKDEKGTPELVHELRGKLARVAPEARVLVKELQQGKVMLAPVEVRISGEDLTTLKSLGSRVRKILQSTPGAEFVYPDFHEDRYLVEVDTDPEVANRLGVSDSVISMLLAGAFSGAPVTTFWEGDRAVDIVLRLDEQRRRSFENVRDAYVFSPITGARVPLREMAKLKPTWTDGRIVRRNGVRTLTVESFFDNKHLASQVLNAALPEIQEIQLPAGYRINLGGEHESQQDTFSEMVRALFVSLIAIFLILLLQFHSLIEALVVMASIPLALLGAALGLFLTSNPFGFTAFMGVVSLSGVVVRNAIILVDYIREQMAKGIPIERAALEAGERRLRPIFLTSMAAAVGVTPMILSRSTLWSPLASVIAVGLIFSMFFTLVVVPVLYVLAMRRRAKGQEQEA